MFELPKYGHGVCLARLADLLDALEIDRARLQRTAIVVTGSNGKGSTAAFTASIARAHGLRTGLFTSPHLIRFNERFQIDGETIDDVTLARMVLLIEIAVRKVSRRRGGESFGAFEAQFALACLYFQEAACDFAVFEAGIGGRYDPVRLVGARTTCVTSIDIEHAGLLGDTLDLIISDKSDACAAGGTIVYGENCRPLRDHIAEYNRNRNVAALFVGDEVAVGNDAVALPMQRFDLDVAGHRFRALEIALLGAFQINNAAIAVALFALWRQTLSPPIVAIDESALRAGLRDTRWPGRLEVIAQAPLTIIDVGHTPDAIKQSLAGLKASHGADNWILVVGVSRDKSIDAIVGLLAPGFDIIVCTSAHHKGTDAEIIAAAGRQANPVADVHVAATMEDAAATIRDLATSTNRRIYVAGGLFLAIEYATIAGGGDARELEFF